MGTRPGTNPMPFPVEADFQVIQGPPKKTELKTSLGVAQGKITREGGRIAYYEGVIALEREIKKSDALRKRKKEIYDRELHYNTVGWLIVLSGLGVILFLVAFFRMDFVILLAPLLLYFPLAWPHIMAEREKGKEIQWEVTPKIERAEYYLNEWKALRDWELRFHQREDVKRDSSGYLVPLSPGTSNRLNH